MLRSPPLHLLIVANLRYRNESTLCGSQFVFRSRLHHPAGGRRSMRQRLCSLLENRLVHCGYQDRLPVWKLSLSMPRRLRKNTLRQIGTLLVSEPFDWRTFIGLTKFSNRCKDDCSQFGPCYCGIQKHEDGWKSCKVPFPGQECSS